MQCSVAQKHKLHYGRCGKCIACRIDKRQEWATRMVMESGLHPHSVFCTLTYADEPEDGSVSKRDATLWIKRLRKELSQQDRKVRYFLCGEYGDRHGRPHYHAILFGCSVADMETIDRTWGKGRTQVGEVTNDRIMYTARYVLKKIIKQGVDTYEDGRRSEFALMSRNPGLGSEYLVGMANGLRNASRRAGHPLALNGFIQADGRKWPLDRYGRNLLIDTLVDLGESRPDAEAMVAMGVRKEFDAVEAGLSDFKASRSNRYVKRLQEREQRRNRDGEL